LANKYFFIVKVAAFAVATSDRSAQFFPLLKTVLWTYCRRWL